MNENTSAMACIIPHNLPRSYRHKMLQLQEHNYLVVIISLVAFKLGLHDATSWYN